MDGRRLTKLRERVYARCVALSLPEREIKIILQTVNEVCGGCKKNILAQKQPS